tara:strand:- start:606 stop:833 length:228 start_codon:yes stop_codon:yes gene_type:complete
VRALENLCLYIFLVHQIINPKLMSKKEKKKITKDKIVQKFVEQIQPEKNNTLIFGGISVAMSSIGPLIFESNTNL